MAVAYVLDEHLRGPLWWAIQRHNARGSEPIDAVRVGDADGPPFAIDDPELLLWSEQARRILITFDAHSLPGHLAEHLRAGHHSPGFTIRPATHLPDLVEFLALAGLAAEPAGWQDRITYVP
jgi:hypothetical protein